MTSKTLTQKKNRRPGRPTENPENVRAILLNAAERIVAETGFRAMTLSQISQSAQVNAAMVAYYFGNKTGLCRAIAERQLFKFTEALQSLSGKLPGTRPFWDDLLHQLFLFIETHQTCQRIHIWALLEGGEFSEEMAQGLWFPIQTRFRHWLSETRPDWSSEHVEMMGSWIGGSLNQYAMWRWSMPTAPTPAESAIYRQWIADQILQKLFA